MMRTLVILIILFAPGWVILAQPKYDKAFKKVEDTYETGDYKGAEDLLKKFQSKVDKKYGKDNRYTIQNMLFKAKISLAMGMSTDFETTALQTVRYSAASNTENSLPHALILVDIAELFNQFGNYLRSRDFLETM